MAANELQPGMGNLLKAGLDEGIVGNIEEKSEMKVIVPIQEIISQTNIVVFAPHYDGCK